MRWHLMEIAMSPAIFTRCDLAWFAGTKKRRNGVIVAHVFDLSPPVLYLTTESFSFSFVFSFMQVHASNTYHSKNQAAQHVSLQSQVTNREKATEVEAKPAEVSHSSTTKAQQVRLNGETRKHVEETTRGVFGGSCT